MARVPAAVRLPALVVVVLGTAVVLGLLHGREEAPPMPRTRTLLLTGFGPFAGVETNPAWETAKALDGERIGDTLIRSVQLDVVYDRSAEQLAAAMAEHQPDAVLALGVAPDNELRLETVARNRDDCPVPDNDGRKRTGTPIREGGPALLPTGLPVQEMLEALQRGDYPVHTSDDAGGYICNHVFFHLMDGLPPSMPAGFVHVPAMEDPWDLPRLGEAVRTLITVLDDELR